MLELGGTMRAPQTIIARRPTCSAPTELSATRRLLPHSQAWNISASPRAMSLPWFVVGLYGVPSAAERISSGGNAKIRRSRPSASNRRSSLATRTSRPMNAVTRSMVRVIAMGNPPCATARDLLGPEGLRTDPAGLGDVDRHTIGAGVLHLDVAVALGAAVVVPAHAERLVDVVAARRVGGGEPLGGVVEVVDLEAKVVDAGPVLATLGPGDFVVLEFQDGEVDIAIGEVVAARVRIVDTADLLQAEHVDVELGGRIGVLGRNRDVPDLRHGGLLGLGA